MRTLGCFLIAVTVAVSPANASGAQEVSPAGPGGEAYELPPGLLSHPMLTATVQPGPAELLERRAGLSIEAVNLGEALASLSESSGVSVVFSPTLVPSVRVACDCANISVREALTRMLRETGLGFTSHGAQVIVAPIPERPDPDPAILSSGFDAFAHSTRGFSPVFASAQGVNRVAPAPRQGTITGRVTGEANQPVGSVQVHIPELGIGVLSGSDGTFSLTEVPAGTHTVMAQLLGYQQASQNVTVVDGETVEVNFDLVRDALALDAVVVTGTPGGTRTRALGNVVGRINAAEIQEVAPVTSIQDLVGAREPGLTFGRSSGNIGTGSDIRIRGVSSFAMGDQPLIYVDGVRVDNEGQGGPNIRDGRQVSVLEDFSTDEIESIEVIKGAAAATLYGTEASAGVIQIITKRGDTGTPQFDFTMRQGANWLMNAREKIGLAWNTVPETGEIVSFNIWDQEKAAGRQLFTAGHLQSYNLSMRGGTDVIRYYLSTDLTDNQGIVEYNYQRQWNMRANVTVIPHPRLTLDVSTGYLDGFTSFMQQSTGWGIWEQAQWANPLGVDGPLRGFLRARPEAIADVEATRDNQRFTGSVTLTNNPRDWFTHRAIVGIDQSHQANQILWPRHPDGTGHDFGARSLGEIEVDSPRSRYLTLDYSASAQFDITPSIRGTASTGLQYYERTEDIHSALGTVFPSPAIRSMAGAASTTASHQFIENKSVGMYIQQELSWEDRAFLTFAVRGDDNSAFGADFDAAIYPKVSGTWVVSEEEFWLDWEHMVNSLRLRGAWGQAGRQPDTFAAVTLFRPEVGPGGRPGVAPDVLGNPDLGPEVSSELELGFDAAFLNNRVTSQFTYYTQKVADALVNVPVAPNRGFPGSQSVNLGQLSNWGWELLLDARALERSAYSLDLTLGIAKNENRVDDIGGLPGSSTLREGFPYPSHFWRDIVHAEFEDPDLPPQQRRVNRDTLLCAGGTGVGGRERGGDPVPCFDAPEVFFGTAIHPWEMSFQAGLNVLQSLRLHAFAEMRTGGAWTRVSDVGCKATCFGVTEMTNTRSDPKAVAHYDGMTNAVHYAHGVRTDFAKLREVGVSYTLPAHLTERMRASRASVNLAGRNLWTIWTRWSENAAGEPIPDPEMDKSGDPVASNSNMPPLSSVVMTVRMSF